MRAEPTTKEREDVSEALVQLLLLARGGLQREIDTAVPANEFLLLIFDGTSPLASLAPPHVKAGGARSVAVKAVRRTDFIRTVEKVYPILAEGLKVVPECGHLEYLASVAKGGVVHCTTCDLGMKPTPTSKKPS